MGTDGGVNESGQAVTSEVRIGDFIDNSDIQIYRQLGRRLDHLEYSARFCQSHRRAESGYQAPVGPDHGWAER